VLIRFVSQDLAPVAIRAIRQETKRIKGGVLAIKDPQEKIHQVRVSCKRLRAMLYLIRPALSPLCYNDEKSQIRAVAKKLGGMRDQDVRMLTLQRLLEGKAGPDLVRRLSVGLQQDPLTTSAQLNGSSLEEQVAPLLNLRKRCQRWATGRFREKQLRQQLSRQYAKGRRLWRRLQKQQTESRLHAWRSQAKGFYLQLSCLLPGERKTRLRKRFKRLAEALGQLHDLHMLRDWVGEHRQGFFQDDLNQLALLIRQREAALLAEVWPLAEKIYHPKPRPLVDALLQSWKRDAAAV